MFLYRKFSFPLRRSSQREYTSEMLNTMTFVGRCQQQWYGCLKKIPTKDVINVSNNTLSNSACSFHRKFVSYLTQRRYMSINNDSEKRNQSDVEKLLEDATVPEESTVVGDTENWSTSPYPKGLI